MLGWHEFRCVGQGEQQFNAFRTDHFSAAMPPGIIDVEHDMSLVVWVDSCFEELKSGIEGDDIHTLEPQEIATSTPRMNETIDVKPGIAVAVGNALAFPLPHPDFAEDTFRAMSRFVLTPEFDAFVRIFPLP